MTIFLWENYIVAAVVTVNLILSIIIIIKAKERKKGITFFVAMQFASLYFLSNMGVDLVKDATLQDLLLRFAFFFPLLVINIFVIFIISFTQKKGMMVLIAEYVPIILSVILGSLVLFTDHIIKGVDESISPVGSIKGDWFFIYIFVFIFSLFVLLYSIVFVNRKSTGVEKSQFKYVILGLLLAIFLVVLTNLILPLFGFTQLVRIPSIFSIIFSVFVTYSILKLQLFSLRTLFVQLIKNVILGVFFFLMVIFARIIKDNMLSRGYYSIEALSLDFTLSIIIASILSPIITSLNKILYRFIKPEIYYLSNVIEKIKAQELNTLTLKQFYLKAISILENSFPSSTFQITNEKGLSDMGIEPPKNLNDVINIQTPTIDVKSYQLLTTKKLFYIQAISLSDYIVISQKNNNNAYTVTEIEIIQEAIKKISEIIGRIETINKINNFNTLLQQKVTTQTQALQEAYDQLKKEDEGKNDILNIVSHQLLTPISIIRGEIEEIYDAEGDVKAQKEILGKLAIESKRAFEIVDEILRVSRVIQSGGYMVITKTKVDMVKMIQDNLESFQTKAESKGLKLNFVKPEKSKEVLIDIDQEKINESISNMVDNALNYTQKGGVTVTLKDNPKSIDISIKDTGIGIKKEDLKELFHKFIRFDNAKKVRPDGTGIGLYFVKLVMEAHKGKIDVKSEGEGKGTEFIITLKK